MEEIWKLVWLLSKKVSKSGFLRLEDKGLKNSLIFLDILDAHDTVSRQETIESDAAQIY